MENLRVISADSHVVEPADLWETRLDKKFRDRAPRVVRNSQGKWVLSAPGCAELGVAGLFAAGKRGAELQEFFKKGYEAARPGGWDPMERIKDQEMDGVLAEVVYTSNGMPLYSIPDPELQMACFRTFNDWLAEYCSAAPKRIYGIALISLADIELGIRELERCRNMGLRGAMISNDPILTYESPAYDPFWKAASDLRMPVSLHIVTTAKAHNAGPPDRVTTMTIRIEHVYQSQRCLAIILLSGVPERFPKLQLVSTENDIGWLPYFLYRLDHTYWVADLPPLKPSEYARRQLYATFQDDPLGVALHNYYGADNFMWASDYPHTDSTFPESRKAIRENFASIPPEVARKIVYSNVCKLYQLDLDG